MLRMRRYRVFLVAALVAIALVYYWERDEPWESHAFNTHRSDDVRVKAPDTSFEGIAKALAKDSVPDNIQEVIKENIQDSVQGNAKEYAAAPLNVVQTAKQIGVPAAGPARTETITTRAATAVVTTHTTRKPTSQSTSALHWTSPSQFYPVASGSTIQLPSGKPTTIPRVQHQFAGDGNGADPEKLAAVKAAMQRTWTGYREYAWMHDELKPLTNKTKDPFMGWAATLVDSLDTLYLMDMKEEFAQAVEATAKIDFTTSVRLDIPVFETTIRYLGGLLGAYDVSGRTQKVLLDKAAELGEVLIGAFDTPNRMPVLYYHWIPSMTRVRHRASASVVLAELGSLSLEFTRLAQLTKDGKYYDAIARITDELENLQNRTSVPGLWPTYVDASGCASNANLEVGMTDFGLLGPPMLAPSVAGPGASSAAQSSFAQKDSSSFGSRAWSKEPVSEPINEKDRLLQKDKTSFAEDTAPLNRRAADSDTSVDQPYTQVVEDPNKCRLRTFNGVFSLGGMADSTYEYLPKMHLLLGGQSSQYESMYAHAMKAIDDYMLYRAMNEDNRDVLFAASLKATSVRSKYDAAEYIQLGPKTSVKKDPQTGHLTCFVGGMFGLAAQIFQRQDDLPKAIKMTDGCVWAYQSTASGIMPEEFSPLMCNLTESCAWNASRWYDAVDPSPATRNSFSKPHVRRPDLHMDEHRWDRDAPPTPTTPQRPAEMASNRQITKYKEKVDRQQFDVDIEKRQVQFEPFTDPHTGSGSGSRPGSAEADADAARAAANAALLAAQAAAAAPYDDSESYSGAMAGTQTHEAYALEKIRSNHLPAGFVKVASSGYILRPEAIESVFYMYRITGDKAWRDKGWAMFEAVERETSTASGASAIYNVMVRNSTKTNSMESFWTAETLKYFYLLFSDPQLVSLDDYVLNTEAHPLLRPDAKVS